MLNRWTGAAAIAALVFSHGAAASGLKLLGTQLELPFEYKVISHSQGFDSNYGLRAYDVYEIEVTAGDAKGQQLQINSDYYAPSRVEAGIVQSWVRGEAEKAAAKTDNRSVQPMEIDGFGFNFIDGPIDSKEYPQRMVVVGAINGAMYRLSAFAKETKPLSAPLADKLKAIRLDYADLLKFKSRFDAESSAATGNGWLETPVGRLQLGTGVSSNLLGTMVKRDASGQTVFRRRSFGMHKTGFWTIQNLALSVSCGKLDQDDYSDYIRMTSRKDDKDEKDRKDRYTDVSAPQPAFLAGVAGLTASASGPLINGVRHSSINRWTSLQGDTMFLAQIERLNGSPIESSLSKQLASATPECKLGLPFGAGELPTPAPPAPPAPKPAS
jgi:hypothetical protein